MKTDGLSIFYLTRIKIKNISESLNKRYKYSNKILIGNHDSIDEMFLEAKNSFINCYNVGEKNKISINDIETFEGNIVSLRDYDHNL